MTIAVRSILCLSLCFCIGPAIAQQPGGVQTAPQQSVQGGPRGVLNGQIQNAIGAAQRVAQTQPPQVPVQPPFPALSPQQQARIDQLLAAWEGSSKKTERLQCSFTRWQFRPLQAPASIHATYATGELKYQAPAQGMYRVSEQFFFSGYDEKKAPKYKKEGSQPGEYWICTGKELMEFDRANKKVEILELPPSLQGQQIVSSPLPFVFNLNAAEMKQRYWIRELPPQQQGEFRLEAWPKHRKDRAEFLKVMVVIKADPNHFLPKALVLFPPNFDERNNPERDIYEFSNVQRNGNLLQNIRDFFKGFIDVKPPKDYQVIRNKFLSPKIATQGDATPQLK